MDCIILCGGYATRLYPLTLNKHKALLTVKGKPLLNYILEKLEKVEEVDRVFIVTNDKFYEDFVKWKNSNAFSKEIKIINDGTSTNETRLGGLGDLKFVFDNESIEDDLMVLAGDNLFEFDLNEMVEFFKECKKNTIALYDIEDISKSKNFGILEVDDEGKIISFEEKPTNPKSTLVSTAIYLYTKEELDKIKKYFEIGKSMEGPGYLIPYFMESQDVYGFVLKGKWYDIGSKETYEEVNQ